MLNPSWPDSQVSVFHVQPNMAVTEYAIGGLDECLAIKGRTQNAKIPAGFNSDL